MEEKINTIELFRATGGAITQSGTLTSDLIDLTETGTGGFFSLHLISAGGTVTVTVLVASIKDGTFVAPDTPVTVFAAAAAGTHFASFKPPLTPYMKLLFTETGVAAVTTMDAWLNHQ